MAMAIAIVVVALISYFTAKKKGASDTTAALVGAAAGAGTYYVGTQTEWGQSVFGLQGGDQTALDADGKALLNADGTEALIPAGATVYKDADGNPIRDADGDIQYLPKEGSISGVGTGVTGSNVGTGASTGSTLTKTTGEVLKSWGGVGTAAVIGTAAAVTKTKTNWLLIGGLALGAILLLK